jgi:hypothetical protein
MLFENNILTTEAQRALRKKFLFGGEIPPNKKAYWNRFFSVFSVDSVRVKGHYFPHIGRKPEDLKENRYLSDSP